MLIVQVLAMTATNDTAALGCREPALGAQVRANLGRSLPEPLREHVGHCLACQLERLAFERFEDQGAT